MKRSLIVLCTMLCVSVACAVAWARMNAVVVGGGVLAGAACTTPTTGSELNEGFLGEGYENTWSETVGVNGTINEDATLTGTYTDFQDDWCVSGSKTEGLALSYNGYETYTTWTRGGEIDRSTYIVTLVVYINLKSVTLDAGTTAPLIDNNANDIMIKESSGSYYLYAAGATNSSDIPISTGWHKITLILHPTAASSSLTVDTTTESFQRSSTNMQTFGIGSSHSVGTGEVLSVEVGYAYVNISTP